MSQIKKKSETSIVERYVGLCELDNLRVQNLALTVNIPFTHIADRDEDDDRIKFTSHLLRHIAGLKEGRDRSG